MLSCLLEIIIYTQTHILIYFLASFSFPISKHSNTCLTVNFWVSGFFLGGGGLLKTWIFHSYRIERFFFLGKRGIQLKSDIRPAFLVYKLDTFFLQVFYKVLSIGPFLSLICDCLFAILLKLSCDDRYWWPGEGILHICNFLLFWIFGMCSFCYFGQYLFQCLYSFHSSNFAVCCKFLPCFAYNSCWIPYNVLLSKVLLVLSDLMGFWFFCSRKLYCHLILYDRMF